jgi:hypothetical protein
MKQKIPTIEIQLEKVIVSSEGKIKLDGDWKMEIDPNIIVDWGEDIDPELSELMFYELHRDYR